MHMQLHLNMHFLHSNNDFIMQKRESSLDLVKKALFSVHYPFWEKYDIVYCGCLLASGEKDHSGSGKKGQ